MRPLSSKSSVFKMCFCPHENQKPAFTNSPGLKSVSEKFRFRDGLVWTVGLTVETKLHFQISPAWYGHRLKRGMNFNKGLDILDSRTLSQKTYKNAYKGHWKRVASSLGLRTFAFCTKVSEGEWTKTRVLISRIRITLYKNWIRV